MDYSTDFFLRYNFPLDTLIFELFLAYEPVVKMTD
jgi:hypothetical protein